MADALFYPPPRRRGRNILALLLPIPVLIAAFALIQAIQLPPGGAASIFLIVSIAVSALIPWLGYRLYALSRAGYTLEREGMHIQWGLRLEDIPMTDILWVRAAAELEYRLARPFLSLPGAVLGSRSHPELGTVEFMASETGNLVLVATPRRVYAISPDDDYGFLESFQELVEMGSFSAIQAQSLHPASMLRRVWADPFARALAGVSLLLGLGLIVWTASLISSAAEISVGFAGPDTPRPPTSAVGLVLLPVASTTFSLIDWAVGAVYYRQEETRPLAYMLWIAGVITPALFLMVVFLITRM
ncbi:MAG: PH domain-containing protein [Anaerolineales bacterium]|nr:PH domain-containing protein [Anaerolineales bacterium]